MIILSSAGAGVRLLEVRLPPLEEFLVILQTAALVGLCLRMWRAGLSRSYPYFFSYLAVVLVESVILSLVGYGTVAYGYVWMITEILSLAFYTLLVLECYATVLGDLAGLATLSRRYIKRTVGIAILAAVLLIGLEKTPRTVFQYFYVIDRAVVSSLLVFVLLMIVFLLYYPVPLSRNVIVYSAGYSVYFLTKATALLIRNANFNWQTQISTLLIAVSTACLLFWGIFLNRQGETRTVVVGHQWHRGDEERLISQLKAINSSASRAARK